MKNQSRFIYINPKNAFSFCGEFFYAIDWKKTAVQTDFSSKNFRLC